jgi:hypothetical protein
MTPAVPAEAAERTPTPVTLQEVTRRVAALRAAELQLWEVLGRWVRTTEEPEAKLLLDRHSQQHAWRAAQLWDRLPVLADVDRRAVTDEAAARSAAATTALESCEGSIARLAGTYRVALPRLAVRYQDAAGGLTVVGDAPLRRILGLLAPDLRADWLEGEALLQRLVDAKPAADPAAGVDIAARTVARLEPFFAAPAAGV